MKRDKKLKKRTKRGADHQVLMFGAVLSSVSDLLRIFIKAIMGD